LVQSALNLSKLLPINIFHPQIYILTLRDSNAILPWN
jgi:hypothetical protein